MYYERRNRDGSWWVIVIAVIIVVNIIVAIAKANSGADVPAVTICSKERAATDGGGEYRIYTDKGTYTMKDVLFIGGHRLDTADDYGRLKTQVTYDIHTIGWRVGFFSWFPNIMEFKESAVQNPDACR